MNRYPLTMIIPVILSGGVGSRLWPLSRALYPKQLLPLLGTKTMLQQTVGRIDNKQPIIVVCQEIHRFLVKEQLEQIDVDQAKIILEPEGRNTAPAIAVAAWQALQEDPQATILAMPADHLIMDNAGFLKKIELAQTLAQRNLLVTFGIKPTYPETGYGYIKTGKLLSKGCFKVDKFVEKPDLNIAQQYLSHGDYFWNSGIFLFKAQVFLDELEKHHPEIYHYCKESYQSLAVDNVFIRPQKAAFVKCPDESIDYAVMEKTELAAIVPADIGWSDIGSWKSLWQASPKDQSNNVTHGDVITEQSHNCHIHAGHRLVTTVGTQNLVIVETADAVLVADKTAVQNVKKIVDKLKLNERSETILHRKVYRPWGTYEGIDVDEKFQVKRITVKPGEQLSLQKHKFRAEHWVVVRGVATVTCNDECFDILENESTYIPLGALHRLENKRDSLLELIEVQTGNYFGEDDIERLDDRYGRGADD